MEIQMEERSAKEKIASVVVAAARGLETRSQQ